MHTRSESSSPQLTPVNCVNLDELVLEYLAEEGLIEVRPPKQLTQQCPIHIAMDVHGSHYTLHVVHLLGCGA